MTERAVEPYDTVVCLYDRYGPSLYRYALMLLTDQAAAEDAVHEVFTAMLRSGASARLAFDERYLRRAIRNECFSMLRQRAKRRQIQAEPDCCGGTGLWHHGLRCAPGSRQRQKTGLSRGSHIRRTS